MSNVNIHNIQQHITRYFAISEFIGPRVFNKYGSIAWRFFDPRLLLTMYILRMRLGNRITINTWRNGGKFKERGLRINIGAIVMRMVKLKKMYLSPHIRGAAVDFDVEDMSAGEVRLWILTNQHLFPFKIRLEAGTSWVHLDVDDEPSNPKVYIFKP